MMMTPKSQTIAQEKRIGRGNRHVRGIGQAFAECAQRARVTEEPTVVDPFEIQEEEPVRPATDGMIRYAWSLATYRDMPGAVRDGMLLVIEDHRAGRAVLDFTIARAFIDRYKDAGQRKREAAPSPVEVTKDGMYRDPESGQIFKVQFNRASGDGRRLYAKALVIHSEPERDEDGKITTPAEVSFEYAPGAMRKIKPEWRMTKDEAIRFGALYGTCVRCGRTLTLEASIERAMGSTCANAKNWS